LARIFSGLRLTGGRLQRGAVLPVHSDLPRRGRAALPQAAGAQTYRLPGGPIIPLTGAGISTLLLVVARPKSKEWLFAAEVLALGILIWASTALLRRRLVRRGAAGAAKVS